MSHTQQGFDKNTKKAKNLSPIASFGNKTATGWGQTVGGPISSKLAVSQNPGQVTGVSFYKEVLLGEERRRNQTQVRRGVRNGGVLLLSNYKPKDFGNAKIDLTVDGGQHLRSPGDAPPQITKKNVEQIFKDPVFNHKRQI